MSMTCSCDAPGCSLIVPAVVLVGRPSVPQGWIMQCTSEGKIVVACNDKHINEAIKVPRA